MSKTEIDDEDYIFDLYYEAFGEIPPVGMQYDKPWKTFDEMLALMKEAVKTGVPIKATKRPPQNPYRYINMGDDEVEKALYDYWERFHVMFPIGLDSPCPLTKDGITKAIKNAMETGEPVKARKAPDGIVY